MIVPYDSLPEVEKAKSLDKLAVLKVNGGLGTSMGQYTFPFPNPVVSNKEISGMTGAKSALEVKNDMTFLDLIVRQIELLNTHHKVDVPLILMTSFNTHDDTLRIVKKYANQQLRITTFNQSRYPRIYKESLMPCPRSADDEKDRWYPPGHGDVYTAIVQSGVLEGLLREGKEYLFISNSDNLGAVCVINFFSLSIGVWPLTACRQSRPENFAVHGPERRGVHYGGHRQDQGRH